MITNKSEFPYSLSIHAAGMLMNALDRYVEDTVHMHDEDKELPSYCCLRLYTAQIETERLRAWAESVPNNHLAWMVKWLDELLKDLKILRDKFNVLEQEELKELRERNKDKK